MPALRGRVAQLRSRDPPLTSVLNCAPAHQDAAVLRFCAGASRGVESHGRTKDVRNNEALSCSTDAALPEPHLLAFSLCKPCVK